MDEKLVEAVRSFPCLWQVSSKSYKDLRAKEYAWKEVVRTLGDDCTVEICSRRWKTLRDKFVRELKKTKDKKSGDAGPVTVSSWPLFEPMKFVSDTVKHKSTVSNFGTSASASRTPTPTASLMSSTADESLGYISPSETDDDQSAIDNPGPNHQQTSPKRHHLPKRKREAELDPVEKTINRLENLKEEDHQNNAAAFGNHVAARLRSLSPRQYANAYLQIEKVLVDTQFPPSRDSYSISSPQPPDYYTF